MYRALLRSWAFTSERPGQSRLKTFKNIAVLSCNTVQRRQATHLRPNASDHVRPSLCDPAVCAEIDNLDTVTLFGHSTR